jgi:hypothetical protein
MKRLLSKSRYYRRVIKERVDWGEQKNVGSTPDLGTLDRCDGQEWFKVTSYLVLLVLESSVL